jgi:hypothetical protein
MLYTSRVEMPHEFSFTEDMKELFAREMCVSTQYTEVSRDDSIDV